MVICGGYSVWSAWPCQLHSMPAGLDPFDGMAASHMQAMRAAAAGEPPSRPTSPPAWCPSRCLTADDPATLNGDWAWIFEDGAETHGVGGLIDDCLICQFIGMRSGGHHDADTNTARRARPPPEPPDGSATKSRHSSEVNQSRSLELLHAARHAGRTHGDR